MSRTQLVWILLGLIALMSGCHVGAHPFDYCGPTYTGGPGGCSLCAPRAGSILSGPPPIQSPPAAVQPVGNIDFGPDILSATEDHAAAPIMGNPGAPRNEAIVEGPVIGEEGTVVEGPDIAAPSPAPQPKAADSAGWTAVRHHETSPPESGNQ
jgi:hypothetical protein